MAMENIRLSIHKSIFERVPNSPLSHVVVLAALSKLAVLEDFWTRFNMNETRSMVTCALRSKREAKLNTPKLKAVVAKCHR
jgi:uncharacterized membrane protein